MFTTVWEYEVDEGSRRAFELAYGKDGDWVRLFRQAHGYQETALLHDVEDPRRYVTLDRWSSRAAYEEFRIVHAAAYAELDERTAGLTAAERHLGSYHG